MNSNRNSSSTCSAIVDRLQHLISNSSNNELISNHLTLVDIVQLASGCDAERNAEIEDKYSSPVLWIGTYIYIASLICVLAIAADLFHAFRRSRKLWVPCKYFTLNAASLTVIAVAMKLPLDLTTPMPGEVDETAKLTSLAFLATIMVHMMPSLASMDNKTLIANVTGLSILAITVCVNIYIQINTTLISPAKGKHPFDIYQDEDVAAYIYTGFMLVILMITISFSFTIPGFKEIINSKYQIKDKDLTDQHMQPIEEYVRRYWVMAQTGSPQFMMLVGNPLIMVCAGVCYVFLILLICFRSIHAIHGWQSGRHDEFQSQSPYKGSTQAILYTQMSGITCACGTSYLRITSAKYFGYKSGDSNSFMLLRVEDYWTKKLREWKQHRILFLSSSRRSRRLIHISKDVVLTFCILFQIVLVFSCKVTLLMLFVFCKLIYLMCFRWWVTTRPITSTPIKDPDLNNYVLTVDDDIQISRIGRKLIIESVNPHISKAEKEQNLYLLQLILQSTGFEGVRSFDTNQVEPLPPFDGVNSWSLPVVTLTCIAAALPNIPKVDVRNLLESVNEGLSFTHLVEETLNCEDTYVELRKLSMALWLEVDIKSNWLGIRLSKRKKPIEIVKWLSDRAYKIVKGNNVSGNKLIAAKSMYRITETILHRFQSNSQVTERQLFDDLEVMIGDIFSACFTNIPRVIRMKCSESVIEKRDESVKAAAKILGKTTLIRKELEARQDQVPTGMNDDQKAYIDEWRKVISPS